MKDGLDLLQLTAPIWELFLFAASELQQKSWMVFVRISLNQGTHFFSDHSNRSRVSMLEGNQLKWLS